MKFRNWSFALIMLALLIATIITAVVLLITSFVWIPILIVASPFIAVLYFVIKKTSVGAVIQGYYFKAYDFLFYRSEGVRRFLWEEFYDFICWMYPGVAWKVMNYGYAILNKDGKLIQDLNVEFEDERFPLQLYHYVATQCGTKKDLSGLNILEVGSGRGGGLTYLTKNLQPASSVGVDISKNQIDFCNENYSDVKNLKFHLGDSEDLPGNENLKPESFDLVINVESSHCYGKFKSFIQGVDKVLKSGGVFAITDFRSAADFDKMKEELESYQMKIIKEEDITINVLHALDLDEKRRIELINTNVHSILRPLFKKFSGLNGSRINQDFRNKEVLYKVFILKKN